MRAVILGAAVALLAAACVSGAAPSTTQADCERHGGVWRPALGGCERSGSGAGGGAM